MRLQSIYVSVATALLALGCVVQSDQSGNGNAGSSASAAGTAGNAALGGTAGTVSGTSAGAMNIGGSVSEPDAGSFGGAGPTDHDSGVNHGGFAAIGGSSTGGSGTAGSTGTGGTGAVGCTESAAMTGMTAAHNAVRALVDPPNQQPLPPLEWSCDVADVAQAYADHLALTMNCGLLHSMGDYGENLFWSSGFEPSPQEVVDAWASEEPCYSYDVFPDQCVEIQGVCNVCGHYTQMVWRDTTKVGCGRARCGNDQVWVCNYDPPGNYLQQYPY